MSDSVLVLMYAMMLQSCAAIPRTCKKALDAATTWTRSWRFNFAVGLHETAVMCSVQAPPIELSRRWARARTWELFFMMIELASSHPYVLARGERRMAACLSWTASHTDYLPLHFIEKLFRAHVQPSIPRTCSVQMHACFSGVAVCCCGFGER